MMQPPSDYDLSQGESPESTTSYGLHFLDMIRRTKDKRYVLLRFCSTGLCWQLVVVQAQPRI